MLTDKILVDVDCGIIPDMNLNFDETMKKFRWDDKDKSFHWRNRLVKKLVKAKKNGII